MAHFKAARSVIARSEVNKSVAGKPVGQSVIDAAARGDETDCVLGTVVAVAQDDTVRRRHDSTAKCSVIMEKLVGESVAGDKVPRLLSAGKARGGCT